MKTLREWYDGLTDAAKKLVKTECVLWFDENQPDCYRKVDYSESKYLAHLYRVNKNSNCDLKDFFALSYLSLYKETHTIDEFNKRLLDTFNKLVTRDSDGWVDQDISSDIIFMTDDIGLRKDLFKMLFTNRRGNLPFNKALYLLDDYSDVPKALQALKIEQPDSIYDGLQEIIGKAGIKALLKAEPTLLEIHKGIDNEMFDEMFFCEDGWTDAQCRTFLERTYCSTYSHKIVEERYQAGFRDFIKRVVAVEPKYLRYMYSIIDQCPALGNKIYEEKKPDSELTGNETPEMTFRYSKLIRKLGRIANICSRKSLSGVNGKALKEISPMIKLYGYNFNDIYDCIMDIEENA